MHQACSPANFKTLQRGIDFTKIIAPCLIGAMLCFPALVKAASLTTDLLAQISRDSGTLFLEDTNFMQEATGPLVDGVGVTATGASASASIDLDYGLFRTQTSGLLTYGGTGTDYVEVLANGQSSDLVTITGGTSGTIGTLTAQVFISGSGNATAPVTQLPGFDEVIASYSVELANLYGYGGTAVGGGWTSTSETFVGDPPEQAFTLTTQFVFGDAWELALISSLHVAITPIFSGAGTYQGDVNLSNTITWLGIDSITDEFGNPIGSFNISSESGFDWSNAHPSAVPIPPALWLFGSGLLGLVGMSRRKKVT